TEGRGSVKRVNALRSSHAGRPRRAAAARRGGRGAARPPRGARAHWPEKSREGRRAKPPSPPSPGASAAPGGRTARAGVRGRGGAKSRGGVGEMARRAMSTKCKTCRRLDRAADRGASSISDPERGEERADHRLHFQAMAAIGEVRATLDHVEASARNGV